MQWREIDARTYLSTPSEFAVAQHFRGTWFLVKLGGGEVDDFETKEQAMDCAERLKNMETQ